MNSESLRPPSRMNSLRIHPAKSDLVVDDLRLPNLVSLPPQQLNVELHPLTNRFLNFPLLEEEYQKRFAIQNLPRVFTITSVILMIYCAFTAANLGNLFSEDASIRTNSEEYFLLVYPVLIPCPFLLIFSKIKSMQKYFQIFYTALMILLGASFLTGGMHSMMSEWSDYVKTDLLHLLDFLEYSDTSEIFNLDTDAPSCNCTWWSYSSYQGTKHTILFQYLQQVLLPAATMNINLLRLLLLLIVVTFLKIDTIHYAAVLLLSCITYTTMTLVYYPSSQSLQFMMNKVLVVAFPIIASVVLFHRTLDYERIMRLEFLHVWSVERDMDIANRQKELVVQENEKLRKRLEDKKNQSAENLVDLESPMDKIMAELQTLQNCDLSPEVQQKLVEITAALARVDQNLFLPDISAQMNDTSNVFDTDTKNWAVSVLGSNKYSRKKHAPRHPSVRVGECFKSEICSFDQYINLVPLQEQVLLAVSQQIDDFGWDLDIFRICKETQNKPLFYTAWAIFQKTDLLEACTVDRNVFINFLKAIEEGYLDNPYHNSSHAADVANSVNFLITKLQNGQIRSLLTKTEYFAALVAAVIHDYAHPGKSNLFMVNSRHDLAIQYSDQSVLERMHVAEAFFVAKDPTCDIFRDMKEKDYRDLRKAIIEIVLSTDLSMHLILVSNLKTAMLSDKRDEVINDPMLLMSVVIKCADIGHAAKKRSLHGQWSALIIEEFFLQGDEERTKNLKISPFMDRNAENSAKNQLGFFEFIVLPFFETVSYVVFDNDFLPILESARTNYQLWKHAVQLELTSIEKISERIFKHPDFNWADRDTIRSCSELS